MNNTSTANNTSSDLNISLMLAENARRHARRHYDADPISGRGSVGRRVQVSTGFAECPEAWLPEPMLADENYPLVKNDFRSWQMLRFRHDFEYWAAVAVMVKDKLTGDIIPLVLNRPQRHVLATLESMRLARRPIRIILLKARQWGGSTLTQMYMAWIQSVHRRNWHSLVCAHVKDAAAQIRGMYSRMLAHYPIELWDGDPDREGNQLQPKFRPYEKSLNISELTGRGCCVTLGTAENPEAVRSGDYAMAHLSEAAFWGDTSRRSPDDFIRAVCSGILLAPLTFVAVESTANGVGNWFHREWLRAAAGESDKVPVFVPWYEIDLYSAPLPEDPQEYVAVMSEYEMALWNSVPDITLEQLYWYHCKRREYPSASKMFAEFPSTPDEAFTATDRAVFDLAHVDRMRAACVDPEDMQRGELVIREDTAVPEFVPDNSALLSVVEHPQAHSDLQDRYVVGVDVGGRSENSDFSVITVIDRQPIMYNQPLRVVAQWRGHCDYDMLALKAIDIARYYNEALLVVESNTVEHNDASPGGMGVLQLIGDSYRNVYRRTTSRGYCEIADEGRVGFHTNHSTKLALVARLQTYVRLGMLKESFAEAADEFATYEEIAPGVFSARPGCHDDQLMARALAVYVSHDLPAPRTYDIPPLPRVW